MTNVMGRPVSPNEIVDVQRQNLPPEVFDAFNAAIAKSMNGKSSKVIQSDVAKDIADRLGIELSAVYAGHYLDVEDEYRKFGWRVDYDRPAYNESYAAFFVFSRGKSE